MNNFLRPSHLIQRGAINQPVASQRGMPLHQAVQLDYMGNALFSSDRLQHSVEILQQRLNDLRVVEAPSITENGKPLMVLQALPVGAWPDYEFRLRALRNQRVSGLYTEEATSFDPSQDTIHIGGKATDFWWDLNNATMWSFNKEFMSQITEFVRESWSIPIYKPRPRGRRDNDYHVRGMLRGAR